MDNLDNDILARYLTSTHTEEDLMRINAWINESPRNKKEFFLLEEAFQTGKQEKYESLEFIAKSRKKLQQRIEQETGSDQQANKGFRIHLQTRRFAAAVVILMVCSLGLSFLSKKIATPKDLLVSVPIGQEIKELILPDGSKVWINQGSSLKYPGRFAKKNRLIHLEGEAYFEVKPNAESPFIVKSEAMRVRVLGTSFNMKSKKEENIAEVVLVDGEVEVRGNNNEGLIVLSPGQKAELNRHAKRLLVKEVNAKISAVWRHNMLPFEKATIFEIANTLEQIYDVKIILSPDIKATTYSGTLIKRSSIDSVLNSLKHSIPINYKITGKTVHIQQAP